MPYLNVAIKPSLTLINLLFILHGLAIFALLLAGIPEWCQVAGALLITLSFWQCLKRQKGVITRLCYQGTTWQAKLNRQPELIAVELSGKSYLTSWLSILRFRGLNTNKWYSIVILPDSLSSAEYRQLRVVISRSIR